MPDPTSLDAHTRATRGARAMARRPRAAAFTLLELLVVIGLILVLISILIPVIGAVRESGRRSNTAATIAAIDQACQAYYQEHGAWPGPLADSQLGFDAGGVPIDSGIAVGPLTPPADGFYRSGGTLTGVTASENLTLGLLGGLYYDTVLPGIAYNPAGVGRGPVNLSTVSPGGYSPYLAPEPEMLSTHTIGDNDITYAGAVSGDKGVLRWGRFVDSTTAARDTIIPEFVDSWSDPMPILYLRAAPVGQITAEDIGTSEGRIIATNNPAVQSVYNMLHIDAYVGPTGVMSNIVGGGPKDADDRYTRLGTRLTPEPVPAYHGLQVFDDAPALTPPADATAPAYLRGTMSPTGTDFTYPFDARAYFLDPNSAGARQADRYVLISAGPDRIYGTEDDITNFGPVRP